MNNEMIIYQITLPKKEDATAFVKFMREKYFPAILKIGQTRVGQVTGLALLQRRNEFEGDDFGHDFFWHVGWDGNAPGNFQVDNVADKKVARKFETFKASVKRIGFYGDVAESQGDVA